ncbi:MAG: hypothetical protein BWY09_00516 [Candidatus Hydrogenedentes bacterium ADurb.Bin179]|nr:MAG: hypothetical protein BWY09_00516 [Candidatus Hydrogenedentes bacterium ADurb.Bin179]
MKSGICIVIMTATTLTAVCGCLNPEKYTLEIDIEGKGEIVLSPTGGRYDSGTTVTVTAVPEAGWCLHSWSFDATNKTATVIVNSGPIDVGQICLDELSHELKIMEDTRVQAVFMEQDRNDHGKPEIVFDEVPAWGSTEDLTGKTLHVTPQDYRVALAIYTSNWFNKPFWTQKTLIIRDDGTWSGDITTGTGDQYATKIFAALVPKDYVPPTLNNTAVLPVELLENAVAFCQVRRTASNDVVNVFHLSLNQEGEGGVSLNPPGGHYDEGGTVTLTATPGPGWRFDHYAGAIEDTQNPATIVMDENKTVTAVFAESIPRYNLDVSIEGKGVVTLDPPGGHYDEGGTVTLTATPGPGWRFDHYAGAIEDTQNPATIVMNENKTVTAVFSEVIPRYTLDVSIEGEGMVILDPPGGTYDAGTPVTLTAVPEEDWCLAEWKTNSKSDTDPGGNVGPITAGKVCLSNLTKVIEMTEDTSVSVLFQYEIPGGPGNPVIRFDGVPAWGTLDNLKGYVLHIEPEDYHVAVAIYTSNWFNKPTWTQKTVIIRADGTWTADITTGTGDQYATKIFAALVPKGYVPPTLNNVPVLPADFLENALATIQVERNSDGYTRMITFSGFEWYVRNTAQPEGPPSGADGLPNPGNYFSDAPESVWVDSQGKLHLVIRYENNLWKCAEVICANSLGYGTYTFTVATNPADIDLNAVAGLFLWSDDPAYNHREIDIEFSQWTISDGPNIQYVIQPWDIEGNRFQFDYDTGSLPAAHTFTWTPESIQFSSEYEGSTPHLWEFTGPGIPLEGDEHPRINLWLSGGYTSPPSDGQIVELVLESFDFFSN